MHTQLPHLPQVCGKAYCLVCKMSWHRGVRCEDVPKGDEASADASFTKFVAGSRLKQCPACNFWVRTRGPAG